MSIKHQIFNKEYRADMNGLRALAVILVLLFHLEFDLFRAIIGLLQ